MEICNQVDQRQDSFWVYIPIEAFKDDIYNDD